MSMSKKFTGGNFLKLREILALLRISKSTYYPASAQLVADHCLGLTSTTKSYLCCRVFAHSPIAMTDVQIATSTNPRLAVTAKSAPASETMVKSCSGRMFICVPTSASAVP